MSDYVIHDYQLFGCPACRLRWWTVDDERNPGHVCPEDLPPGGLMVARLRDSVWTPLRTAAA
jgi:hypothetical protein